MSELLTETRSATEVLGYVVVFALVLTSIGFITALGLPQLEDVRDAEQAANAERAFDVVADNMAAIYERDAPSRATEIDLSDSELFYANNVSMEIAVDDGSVTQTYEFQIRPVQLRISDDASLVYEGGAVFRVQEEGGVVLREPPFLVTEDRVHAPVVQTTAPGIETARGTTVLLRGQSSGRAVVVSNTAGAYDSVNITVASPRYELWNQTLSQRPALDCSTDPGASTVTCSVDDPELVYVTRQKIDVSIIL